MHLQGKKFIYLDFYFRRFRKHVLENTYDCQYLNFHPESYSVCIDLFLSSQISEEKMSSLPLPEHLAIANSLKLHISPLLLSDLKLLSANWTLLKLSVYFIFT